MENPYIDYYLKQAGSGITGYSGNRYHVGRGFFGKILKNLKPALKYIGKQGWETLKSISSDVMSGESIGDATTNSLIGTASNIMTDAKEKLQDLRRKKQKGGGKRKKRKNRVKKVNIKKVYKKRNRKKSKKRVKRKSKITRNFL